MTDTQALIGVLAVLALVRPHGLPGPRSPCAPSRR